MARRRSMVAAVNDVIDGLNEDLQDGVLATGALALAEIVDRAADPQFKTQSISASCKQLIAMINELRELQGEQKPADDPLDVIAKRRIQRAAG